MNGEPRGVNDYGERQILAARRVLIDVAQVLGSFVDCFVVVGGWVPDLLLHGAEEPHSGSIDVDLALNIAKLKDGRYADLLKLLLGTGRFIRGNKPFQFVAEVDLGDEEIPVGVELEFLAPKNISFKKNKPKLLHEFRVLQIDGCESVFREPKSITLTGEMIRGTTNTVNILVAALPDFLIMKAFAIEGRDKPKDSYDLCYCLDYYPGGIEKLAGAWKRRRNEKDIQRSLKILKSKFATVDSYGPSQVVDFFNSADQDQRDMQARRAFELVQSFLSFM